MIRFVIDANLPHHFKLWHNEEFVHVTDIGPDMPDHQIWHYAKERQAIIVTKDVDFSDRILATTPPPKVIHIKAGNLRIKDFYRMIHEVWDEAVQLTDTCKLVRIFPDRIEGVQ